MFGKKLPTEAEIILKEERIDLRLIKYEAETQLKGNKQRNEYECDWHNEREDKRTELAKLDAEIAAKKALLEDKDLQIAYLREIINELARSKSK